jgi:uncharacterized protein YkwD
MNLIRNQVIVVFVTLLLSSASAFAQTAPANLQTLRQQALAKHNALRAKHGAPALKVSAALEAAAQAWAVTLAAEGTLRHSGAKYGENLYLWSGSQLADGGGPVQTWYDEVRNYNFNNATFSPTTSHFTQVVWKGTTELGCGAASGAKGTFVVCNYNPAGNLMGTFKANVLPAR